MHDGIPSTTCNSSCASSDHTQPNNAGECVKEEEEDGENREEEEEQDDEECAQRTATISNKRPCGTRSHCYQRFLFIIF
jgi:hypothetical protein